LRQVEERATPHPQKQPEPLSPVDRWRLEYVMRAIEPLSLRWPWMTTQRTCIMLISLRTQWVLNCDRAPAADFARQSGDFRGRPVFARAGTELMLEGKEVPCAAFVQAVPATASVPNPKQSSSDVAREDPFIIASSLDTLVGTHPAFPANTTTEEWMSIFVHEFFHTRQLLLPAFSTTYAEMYDGRLDRNRLVELYEKDAQYRALVQQEFELLSGAARSRASVDARDVLRRWRVLYKRRRDYLNGLPDGALLVRADVVYSYVEGVARYVENMFLVDPRQVALRQAPAEPCRLGAVPNFCRNFALRS
jgi:hypothetical protein